MNPIRTRFAPSPTGIMHIGNVRAALLNYLFAKQNNGTFILRIEDTDQQRNIESGTEQIIKHLQWLSLHYTEGPEIDGNFGPYFQSKRFNIYEKYLTLLFQNNFIYRCFCSPEELEIRKNRQIAMKKPSRYEGTCLKLTESEIDKKLQEKTSFIWRMKIDVSKKISFKDLARGMLEFDLQHFSDFPLTREDGSFTFIFANCIDDLEMKISHVFRGEEHLSNTVSQVVLYHALNHALPVFWHLPILCNEEGKKLSKRDKGFSLNDVQDQGFLPEAICNYLGILGASFQQEILSLDQLAKIYNFNNIHGASQIRYDIEKLRWINHKWITQLPVHDLVEKCRPFLEKSYDLSKISSTNLTNFIKATQTDLHTLTESVSLLKFYFERPQILPETLSSLFNPSEQEKIFSLLKSLPQTDSWAQTLSTIEEKIKAEPISKKDIFSMIRLLTTGSTKGLQINDLFECLGSKEFFQRINNLQI